MCSLNHIVGQAGQTCDIINQQFIGIGCIKHVLGKLGRQRGLLFLNFGEAGFLSVRQFSAAQAEITQRVLDDFLARRRQARISRAGFQGLVLVEQREVLSKLSPELGDLGLVFVVHRAQLRRIHHCVQMADHAPCAAQLFGSVFEGDDKIIPFNL